METVRSGEPSTDAGLSLVEVMVAMGIFVIGSLSLLSVLTTAMSGTYDNRARVTAANLAAADIDEARSLDYYALSSTSGQKTVDGRSYTVVREVSTVMSSGDTSSCVGSGSSKQRYKRVSTRVETAFRGRTTPVRADTLVKAPVFDPNSARGAIAFVVIDRNGNPLSGLPVNANSTDLTTDARGCTFFDGLLPGTYVVTVTRAGSVKIDGSTTLSGSVVVSAGQITSEVMRIDVAANVAVNVNVYDGTIVEPGHELPSGLAVRLAAPDRETPTRYESAGKAVTAGVDLTWTAYPSPGGYDAYVGPCSAVRHTDSEPGTTPPKIEMALSPVTVQITGGTSDNLKGQGKGISASWLSSPSCTETTTYAGKTATDCKVNSNGTDGCWLYVSLRPGKWRLTLEGGYVVDVQVHSRKHLGTSISVAGV